MSRLDKFAALAGNVAGAVASSQTIARALNPENTIDAVVAWVDPERQLKRKGARKALAYYEAAKPSRHRKFRTDSRHPNVQVQQGAAALRTQARHLEQNHDVARGILRTVVNNVIGPKGIGIEPQPRRLDGSIHTEYAAALLDAYRDWQRKPEVSHRHTFAALQRMAANSWIRDGEVFAQQLIGPVPHLLHGTRVPYSLEVFEADMVPLDLNDEARNIRQGIERNAWGRTTGLHVFRNPPGEYFNAALLQNTKRIPAERVLQLAQLDRFGQLRGISEFAAAITRLEDIKDYEESERVAAKIAAMLTAFVRKGTPDMYTPTVNDEGEAVAEERELALEPGTIIDNLGLGEEIGMIDSKRPNPNVVTFRQGQLRAVAAGVGASYSSIARDYNGTYSAQRQEMVEQWVHYATLTDEFVGQFLQPTWENFVRIADVSGVVPTPNDVKPYSADDALFVGQSMPWIDPWKEARAWETLVKAGFASEVEVIRKRGGNPADVLDQIGDWRKKVAERNLTFSSDAATTQPAAKTAAKASTKARAKPNSKHTAKQKAKPKPTPRKKSVAVSA